MLQATRYLVMMTLILGGLYPLSTYLLGKMMFSRQVEGSLIKKNNEIRGSELIAQKVISDKFFKARPSAGDYATVASGASQWSVTNLKLKEAVNGSEAPMDAKTNSGSGLDPHISLINAQAQVKGVAAANNINADIVSKIVQNSIESPTLGFMGTYRVNVNKLNDQLLKYNE